MSESRYIVAVALASGFVGPVGGLVRAADQPISRLILLWGPASATSATLFVVMMPPMLLDTAVGWSGQRRTANQTFSVFFSSGGLTKVRKKLSSEPLPYFNPASLMAESGTFTSGV